MDGEHHLEFPSFKREKRPAQQHDCERGPDHEREGETDCGHMVINWQQPHEGERHSEEYKGRYIARDSRKHGDVLDRSERGRHEF